MRTVIVPALPLSSGFLRRSSLVQVDGPDCRLAATQAHKSRADDVVFHRSGGVEKTAERVAKKTASGILESQPGSHEPSVAWIREREQPPGKGCGSGEEVGPIRIAADDAMHDDDVGGIETAIDMHDIAADRTQL